MTLFDPKTQRTSIEVEAEHILGVYDAEVHEKYPDEKEIDHLEYPADNGLESTATEDDDSSQLGNGAVFSQTYTGGDVCDHADVTDAAIVQGSSDGIHFYVQIKERRYFMENIGNKSNI